MKFCVEDSVKIKIEKINSLVFNNLDLIEDIPKQVLKRTLKKKLGKIIEYDFFKKKDAWVYLVDFGDNIQLWFVEDEMILI